MVLSYILVHHSIPHPYPLKNIFRWPKLFICLQKDLEQSSICVFPYPWLWIMAKSVIQPSERVVCSPFVWMTVVVVVVGTENRRFMD